MRWLFKFLAFLGLSIFVSALTLNIFLDVALDNVELARESFREQTDVLVNQTVKQSLDKISPDQKKILDQIEKFSVLQRETLLGPQCQQEALKNQTFCNPDFLSGKLTMIDALKIEAKKQIEASQEEAIKKLEAQLAGYKKYPLVLISILGLIAGSIFYILSNGILSGIQTIAGTVSWLALLSSLSFKTMRGTIEKLLSVSQPSGADSVMLEITKKVIFDWLQPAMNTAFATCIWISVIAFVIWGALKLFRNYDVGFERN